MNKKIGLRLAFLGTNYGALLQAFATQFTIEKMGYETFIFEYSGVRDFHPSPEAYVYYALKKITGKFKRKKKFVLDDAHKANLKERKAISQDFRDKYLKNIIKVSNKDSLVNLSKDCNAVLVGSDQLWPPTAAFSNYSTLRFVPTGVKRISYATSMGCDKYPWYVKRNAADFLEKIDFLSVREETAKCIVDNVSKAEATVVLDPTYLLSKEEWKEIFPQEKIVADGYVLCYFLGLQPVMAEQAVLYARQKRLRVVTIMSNEEQADDSYADEVLCRKTPADFLNLIRNAECIFTDSFHGFAFSVINEKQVFVTYRIRKHTYSRNSRIDNIVAKFGMESRLLREPGKDKFTFDEIDYLPIIKKISSLRKDSLEFLKNALEK